MRTRFSRSSLLRVALEGEEARKPRLAAELSAKALRENYLIIQDLVPGQSLLPMVKANAYGHGATWVARQLLAMPSLYGLGVATLEEGAHLRRELGPAGRRTRILVFSGAVPWTEEKGHYCEKHHLTPVIATDEDWRLFLRGGWPKRIPYELKFNTGMNRLGIHANLARGIVQTLRSRPSSWHPGGILSHLALGEDPDASLSRAQRQRFEALRAEFQSTCPAAHYHLANSAAIWRQKNWGLDRLTDVVRPGISLYGVPPWSGAPQRGLTPVMTVRASVIATHALKPGDCVGYGGTFRVRSEPVRVATLAAGYGDGLHRMLSNRGQVWIHGRSSRILGIVSMDLCSVECPADTRVGDEVELLGPHLDPWEQARAAGTIPYELLTSISARVQRVYV